MSESLSSVLARRVECPVAPLSIDFSGQSAALLLDDPRTLAVIAFDGAGDDVDSRLIGVDLPQLGSLSQREVWRGTHDVFIGNEAGIDWRCDGDWCCFRIEVDEADHGRDIAACTSAAYAAIREFLSRHPLLHLARVWNYFDAITAGDGDDERYRRFCVGRDDGLDGLLAGRYPAATAIGTRHHTGKLLVYCLAARESGVAIENPRQLSAWRYPRDYGPVAPGFARAMRMPSGPLLISGTAAIVGHHSQHAGERERQTIAMLENLRSLLVAAGAPASAMRGEGLLLKAYLSGIGHVEDVTTRLRDAFPALAGLIVLGGDVCRRELVVEVEGVLV